MKSKSVQILFHVIGIAIFLSLPILLWPGEGDLSDFFTEKRALRAYISDILILSFFYLNFYLLIPRLYFSKKYIYFILLLVFCFVIIAFLPSIIVPFQQHIPSPQHRPGPPGNRILFLTVHNLGFFLAVVFFSLLLKINNRWKQAEKERLKAELSYFKAQINPHFLFNTLNSIYSLAIQKAENTAEAVVKLSGMMRYVISDANNDFVQLENEISYISDYIELQRIRYGETVKINYNPCEPDSARIIAPLILIPFIENAFKFGVNPEEDSSITIEINISGPEFHMYAFNHKASKKQESERHGGLGISNAKQRLALLYPEKHHLLIKETESTFTVDLYITLS